MRIIGVNDILWCGMMWVSVNVDMGNINVDFDDYCLEDVSFMRLIWGIVVVDVVDDSWRCHCWMKRIMTVYDILNVEE